MDSNEACRYYYDKYPKEESVVVGRIKTLTEIGAYVTLPEYGDIEGLVLHSELMKKRTRNVQKYVKTGSLDAFYVLKVDKEKGYVDMSKKRAEYEEKLEAFEKYYKGKIAHSFMQSVSIKAGVTLAEMYETFGWAAEREFGSLYKCFREVLSGEGVLQRKMKRTEKVTEEMLELVEGLVKQKFVVPKVKVRANAETKCNKGNGVLLIQEILVKIEREYPEVEVALVSSPVFSFTVLTEDGEIGAKTLKELLEKLEKRVVGEGGVYSLAMPPTVFGPRPQFDNESEGSDDLAYSDSDY